MGRTGTDKSVGEKAVRVVCYIFFRRMLEVSVVRYGKRNFRILKLFMASGAGAFI